jgi:hypothetical protein
MSVLEWRGGFPVVFGGTVGTTGTITDDRTAVMLAADQPLILGAHQIQMAQDGRKGPITSKWLEVRNLDSTAANIVKVYFSADHFADDVHYISLPGGDTHLSKWFGPFEQTKIWLRSAAGTPRFEVIAAHRRG